MKFDETHIKALKSLNSMIDGLKNLRWYYEADIEYEYSPFENSIKEYCDKYCEFYLMCNEAELFFDSLKSIIESIVDCNADMYYEDFFRPVELITYYIGKIISSDNGLKDKIREWMADFCSEYEGDMVAEEYFRPFISGEKIYHADNYYTDYDDFSEMISVFK